MMSSALRASIQTGRTVFMIFGVITGVAVCVGTLPALLGYDSFVVTGGSMKPAIPAGAIVVAERVPVTSLEAGDIVTFRPNPAARQLVTHRIEFVKAEPVIDGVTVRTKGDANAHIDPVDTQLTGAVSRLVFMVPLAGYVVGMVRSPVGAPLSALLLLVLLAATYFRPAGKPGVEPAGGTEAFEVQPGANVVSILPVLERLGAGGAGRGVIVPAGTRRSFLVIENWSPEPGRVFPWCAPALVATIAPYGRLDLDGDADQELIESAWWTLDPGLRWTFREPQPALGRAA